MKLLKKTKRAITLLLFACCCTLGRGQNVQLLQVATTTNDIVEAPVDQLLDDAGNKYILYYLDADITGNNGNRGIGLAKQNLTTGSFIYNKNYQCSYDFVPIKIVQANGFLYCLAQILTKYPSFPPTGPVLLIIDPITGSVINSYFFQTPVPSADFSSRAADFNIISTGINDFSVYILGYTQHRFINTVNDSYTPNKLFIITFALSTNIAQYKEYSDLNNNLYFNPTQLKLANQDFHYIIGTVYNNLTQQKLGFFFEDYYSYSYPFSFDIDGKEISYSALTNTDGFYFLYGQIKTGNNFGYLGENEFYFDSPFFFTHAFYNTGPLNGTIAETWHLKNATIISHDKHHFDFGGGDHYLGKGVFLFYSNQQGTAQDGNFGVGIVPGYVGYQTNNYQLFTQSYHLRGGLFGVGLPTGPSDLGTEYLIRNSVTAKTPYTNYTQTEYIASIPRIPDVGKLDKFYTFDNTVNNCTIDIPKPQTQGIVNTQDLNLTETPYSNIAYSSLNIVETDFGISSTNICDEPFSRSGNWYKKLFSINYPGEPLEDGRISNQSNINIFPNPFNNNFTISTTKQIKAVSLYSTNGTLVKKIEQPTNQQAFSKVSASKQNNIKIEALGSLSNGAYGVKVVFVDNTSETKVIIKE